MERNNLIKKGVVVSVLLLLISISVVSSIGTVIVENKNVENNFRNLGLRGAELEVTTDKDVYDPGEIVTIYLTNVGDVILYGGGPIVTIYNNESEIVYQEATYCWHELEPEEYITWTWNQTNQQGSQVPNGFYVVEGALYGVGETFVDSSIIAVTEEDLVVHIDGIEGKNGYYISCVTITVLYDPEVIKEVYVNGEIYVEPVVICEDGNPSVDIQVVDWEGNWWPVMSIDIRIDQTEPVVDITWESPDNVQIRFTPICSDATSGINRAEFFMECMYMFVDYEAPYEWIVNWSSIKLGEFFSVVAFDNAGNFESDACSRPTIQSQPNSQSIQQSNNMWLYRILERFPILNPLIIQLMGRVI